MEANNKKELILQAAFELFASKGYYNTKMIDIAEMAGIGKGTIYEYFPSKDTLYIEFIREKFLSFYKSTDSIFEIDSSSSQKLQKFICFESENIYANGKILGLIQHETNSSQQCTNPDIHKIFFEVQNLRFNIVKKILETGINSKEFKQINPNTAALAVLGSLTAFLFFNHNLHPLSEKIVDDTISIDEFMEILLSGLNHD